jgi:hypothetical protein
MPEKDEKETFYFLRALKPLTISKEKLNDGSSLYHIFFMGLVFKNDNGVSTHEDQFDILLTEELYSQFVKDIGMGN